MSSEVPAPVGLPKERRATLQTTPTYTDLRGVGRATAILEALADAPMRPKELADRLGLKWTTAYRTLTHLREHGFLVRDDDTGVYRIGSRLYFIGTSYLANLTLVEVSQPYIRAAVEQTRTTAQLVERHDDRSVVLMAFESHAHFIPQATVGFHFPLHCGSKGHILLAHAPSSFIEHYLALPLKALTRHTITDPSTLERRLEEVRDQGFATTARDIRLSTGSVAAPVWDGKKNVVAAVTLITSASDLDDRHSELTDVVLELSRAISRANGSRTPT